MSGADRPGLPVEIQWVGSMGGRGVFVFVRMLSTDDFEVAEGATLGGCPLRPFLRMPRAMNADGTPRLDLFAFHLARAEDAHRLAPGMRVDLRPGARSVGG